MNQRPSTIGFLLLLITCAHFVTLTHSIMGSASFSASGRYNDILLWSIATSSSSSSSSSSVQNPKSFLVKSPAAAVVRQDQKKECDSESDRSSRDSGGPHIIVTAPALIEEQVKVVGDHRSLNRDRKHSSGNSIKKHVDRPRYSGSFMLKRTEMMLALEDDGTNDLMRLAHRKNFHWLMDAWTFSNERDAPLHVSVILYDVCRGYTHFVTNYIHFLFRSKIFSIKWRSFTRKPESRSLVQIREVIPKQ